MEYLVVKWIHVVSSTILFGTGIGSAFYMLMAGLRGRPSDVHFVVRHVVIADWLFTATAVVVQPVTGVWLAHLAGMPLSTPWLRWSIVLYVVAGACWAPVLWLQYRMRDVARIRLVAHHGIDQPEHVFMVGTHEVAKGRLIARLCPLDQRTLVDSLWLLLEIRHGAKGHGINLPPGRPRNAVGARGGCAEPVAKVSRP